MGPREIGQRSLFSFRKQLWSRGLGLTPAFDDLPGRPVQHPMVPPPQDGVECPRGLIAEADAMLQGRYTILGLAVQESPLQWNLEPMSGIQCPRVFGPSLKYRDPAVAGEARNLWEKGRQHAATRLAAAFWLSGDQRYSEGAATLLEGFVRENPFPVGINWTSSLEAAIRLINWVWIERLLRGSARHAPLFGEGGVMWAPVRAHQYYIVNHISAGSSANNHLIGEAAGLYVSACAWGDTECHSRLRRIGARLLEREIAKQFFPSGLNREMAYDYHGFALEFLTLAFEEGRRSGHNFGDQYREKLKTAIAACVVWLDAAGNPPRYGDSDGGRVLSADESGLGAESWLLKYGREVLNMDLPAVPGERASLTAAILGLQGSIPSASPSIRSKCDTDAGLYLLASGADPADALHCLVDAGPLGYLSIAAHGHADALSFCLSVGGIPVIVDPGTYCYHGDLARRAYFRGTAAHNTVLVDGASQSHQGGAFLWTRKANARLLRWNPTEHGGTLSAEHDGYRRLPGAVVHRRTVDMKNNALRIEDRLTGGGTHDVEWRLHFHPGIAVSMEPTKATLTWVGGSGEIVLDPQLRWCSVEGAESAGWYSHTFNDLQSTTTLIGRVRSDLPLDVSVDLLLQSSEEERG